MIKKILLLVLTGACIQGYAQPSSDEQAIKDLVNQFFLSLEQQDTLVFKQVAAMNTQVWTSRKQDGESKTAMRYYHGDVKKMSEMPPISETALSFDIKLHKGMAVAWVPYELRINGEFSHCGVDVFTCMKMDGAWKIVSVAYTVETEDCEALKNKR